MKRSIHFCRSSLVTKLAVLLLIVGCAAMLISQQAQIRANAAEAEQLSQQAAQLEQANRDLTEDIAALGSDDSVREIAQEELGLVEDGQIIFVDAGE